MGPLYDHISHRGDQNTSLFFFFFFELKLYGTVGGRQVRYYYIPLREEMEAHRELPSLVQGCITWFLQLPLDSSPSSFHWAALFSRVKRLLWTLSQGMWTQVRKGSRKKCLAFKVFLWHRINTELELGHLHSSLVPYQLYELECFQGPVSHL